MPAQNDMQAPSQNPQPLSIPGLPLELQRKIVDYVGYSSSSQVATLLNVNRDFYALTLQGLYRWHPGYALASFVIKEFKEKEKSSDYAYAEEKTSVHNILSQAVEKWLGYYYGPDFRYSLKFSRNPPALVAPNEFYLYWDQTQQAMFYIAVAPNGKSISGRVLPEALSGRAGRIQDKLVAGTMLAFGEVFAIHVMMAKIGCRPIVFRDNSAIQKIATQFLMYYKQWIYQPFDHNPFVLNAVNSNFRSHFYEDPKSVEEKWNDFSSICINLPAPTSITGLEFKKIKNFHHFLQMASYFKRFLHDLVAILQNRYFVQPELCLPEMKGLFVSRTLFVDVEPVTRGAIAAYICLRKNSEFRRDTNTRKHVFKHLIEHNSWAIEKLSSDDMVILLSDDDRSDSHYIHSSEVIKKLIQLPFIREHFTAQDYAKLAFDPDNAGVLLNDDFVLQKLHQAAMQSQDLAKEPFIAIILASYHASFLLGFLIRIRLYPYINGDCWYQLALAKPADYLPRVLEIPGIGDKLSVQQIFKLITSLYYFVKRKKLLQPEVIERLMMESSSEDQLKLIRAYAYIDLTKPIDDLLLTRINPYVSSNFWYSLALDKRLDFLPRILSNPDIFERMSSSHLRKLLTETWRGEELAYQFLNQPGVFYPSLYARLHRELVSVADEAKDMSPSISLDKFFVQPKDEDRLDWHLDPGPQRLLTRLADDEIRERFAGSEERAFLHDLKFNLIHGQYDYRSCDEIDKYKYVVNTYLRFILNALLNPKFQSIATFLQDILDSVILGPLESTYLRDKYQQKKSELSKLENHAVKLNIQKLLTVCEEVEKEIKQQTSIDEKLLAYRQLVTTLKIAHLAVTQNNPEALYRYAQTLQKQPSLAWKMVGAALVAIGAAMILIGTAIIPTGIGTAPGIALDAAGSALILSGMGFFHHGRRKGMSKAVHQLGKCLPKENIIAAGR